MKLAKFKEFERRAYQSVYAEPAEGFHNKLIPELIIQYFPEFNLQPNSRVLDIGCGPGIFLQEAKKLGHDAVGVTLSRSDFRLCKQLGFEMYHASMTDLPIEDNSIDFIWCRHALEHSPYPLFTLYEFHRVLKPTGKAYIEVPAPDNERMFIHEFNPNHYSILGTRMWQGLFKKSSFIPFFLNISDTPLQWNSATESKVIIEKSFHFGMEKSTESYVEQVRREYELDML